jgi:hypothetical protein
MLLTESASMDLVESYMVTDSAFCTLREQIGVFKSAGFWGQRSGKACQHRSLGRVLRRRSGCPCAQGAVRDIACQVCGGGGQGQGAHCPPPTSSAASRRCTFDTSDVVVRPL